MNTMLTKLKTSATLWSVIGGFILGFANVIWGDDSTAATVASTVCFVAPSVAYIVGKFTLRIKMADVDKNGKIDLQELAAALNLAASETSEEAKEVVDAVGNVLETWVGNDIQEDEEPAVQEEVVE